MNLRFPILAVLAASSFLAARPAAQGALAGSSAILLADGTFGRGDVVSFDAAAGEIGWRRDDRADGERRPRVEQLALERVVAIGGRAARVPRSGLVVRLVGGEVYRGEMVGGDAVGETLTVRSPVLGARPVRIDRVASIVFLDRVDEARSDAFVVPDDVEEDEALFVPARRGFDLVVGLLHRFREDGIEFAARGEDDPRVRPYGTLAGYALRGGEPRSAPASVLLTTVSGDRVGVEIRGLDEDGFLFELEDGAVVPVRRSEVASLTPRVEGRTFLSDLPIVEARERSYFDDGDVPLLPHRLDRSVTGAPLRVAGLGFGKGIGVHARSVLAWRIPEGVRGLVGLVALDDSALELPVRGAVSVTVRQGDDVLLRIDELVAGAGPRSIGLLPMKPGATLRLEVDFGPGLDLGDRVDWLSVAFVR